MLSVYIDLKVDYLSFMLLVVTRASARSNKPVSLGLSKETLATLEPAEKNLSVTMKASCTHNLLHLKVAESCSLVSLKRTSQVQFI